MAQCLQRVSAAAHSLSGGAESREEQVAMLEGVLCVLERSEELLRATKRVAEESEDPAGAHSSLLHSAAQLSDAIQELLSLIPGQRQFQEALRKMKELSDSLETRQLPTTNASLSPQQEEAVTIAAERVSSTTSSLLSSSPSLRAEVAVRLSEDVHSLVETALPLAAGRKSSQSLLLSSLSTITSSTTALLKVARTVSDSKGGRGHSHMTSAARSLLEALNHFLSLCSRAQAGEKEAQQAVADLKAVSSVLEDATQPVSDISYYGCIQCIERNIQLLSTALSDLEETEQFESGGQSALTISHSMCEISEAAAQAAYLVGVSHPSSVPATPGLINQSKVALSGHVISLSCQQLAKGSGKEAFSLARTISQHSSALCEASKHAAILTSSPSTKSEFLRAVRTVANSTATLLRKIEVGNREREDGSVAGETVKEEEEREGEEVGQSRQATLAEVSRPLLSAVQDLETFSSCPQFAAVPAQIGQEGVALQHSILEAARLAHSSSLTLLTTLHSTLTGHREELKDGAQLLGDQSKTLTAALQALLSSITQNTPSLQECEAALSLLSSLMTQLQQANFHASTHTLPSNASSTLQGFLKAVVEVCSAVEDSVKPTATTIKTQVELMGGEVALLVDHFPPLLEAAVGAASRSTTSDLQQNLLDHTITAIESVMQLVSVAKEVRGDPSNQEGHQRVDDAVSWLLEALNDLRQLSEDAYSESGLIAGMVDEVLKDIGSLVQPPGEYVDGETSTAEYQNRVLQHAERLTRAAHDIVLKGPSSPSSLPSLRRSLTSSFSYLVAAAQGLSAHLEEEELSQQLSEVLLAVGQSVVGVLHSSAVLQVHPKDPGVREETGRQAMAVKRKVAQLVVVVEQCGEVAHSCLRSLTAIREMVGEIDITAALLSGGVGGGARKEGGKESVREFEKHREDILSAAKAVSMATEELVVKARGSSHELAEAAREAVHSLSSQTSLVRSGAATLPEENMEGQLLLLTAAKDMADTLEGVLEASTSSSTASEQSSDPLHSSAKKAAAAHSRLVRTVSGVDVAGSQGRQALEETIDFLRYSVEDSQSQVPWPRKEVSYSALVETSKSFSLATNKMVSAGRSRKSAEVVVGVAMGRSAAMELLSTASTLAWNADTEEERENVMSAAQDAVLAYISLLEWAKREVEVEGGRKEEREPAERREEGDGEGEGGALAELGEGVSSSLQDLLQVAQHLRGDSDYSSEEERRDLLDSISDIESVTGQFTDRHPSPTEMPDSASGQYTTDILRYSKAAAVACRDLVQCATEVHQHRVPQAVEERSVADQEWSHSLLQTVTHLSSLTATLCESATMYAQSLSTEAAVMADCRALAGAASRVFITAQVKVEAGDDQQQQMQTALAAVKRATDSLIFQAEEATLYLEEDPQGLLHSLVTTPTQAPPTEEVWRQDSDIIRIQQEMEHTQKVLAQILLE